MRVAIFGEEGWLDRVANGEVKALEESPVVAADMSPYVRVDVDQCSGCAETATWRAAVVTHEQNKEGKLEEKEHAILNAQFLAPEDLQHIQQLAEREPVQFSDDADSDDAGAPTSEDESPAV